jgi:uncharacterized protein YifE (UPF0438 family)
MSQEKSFQTTARFYDDANFPYGISRSGDFTRQQSALLEQFGVALKALCDGTREAATAEEQRFLEVCQGQQPAESEIERTWISYLTAINRRNEYISHTGVPVTSTLSELAEDSAND